MATCALLFVPPPPLSTCDCPCEVLLTVVIIRVQQHRLYCSSYYWLKSVTVLRNIRIKRSSRHNLSLAHRLAQEVWLRMHAHTCSAPVVNFHIYASSAAAVTPVTQPMWSAVTGKRSPYLRAGSIDQPTSVSSWHIMSFVLIALCSVSV